MGNGNDAASAFTRNVGAGAGGPVRALSADNPGGMGLGTNQTMRFRVVGSALDAYLYDQATFFSVLTSVLIDAATYQLATITPASSRFNAAQIAEYISLNPMQLRNINFPNVAGSDAAAATSSLAVVIQRVNPFQQSAQDTQNVNDKATAAEYLQNRAQIALDEKLDGYSSISITNDQQATAVTYTAAMLFGARLDRRIEVTDQGAVIVRSPSQIG